MSKRTPLTPNERNLVRRYLIWCYKTTKEELDKIDRYFTQLQADELILKHLYHGKDYKTSSGNKAYKAIVDQFPAYMKKKEDNVLKKKFKGGRGKSLNPEYLYLKNRFAGIESAIRHWLGNAELKKICLLYEEEMTRRILTAREHS